MKNLLIITQKVDERDDLLGFFPDWIREFSKHFGKVFVITLSEGTHALPGNVFVYSLGKEKNNSKIARAWNFYRLLFKLVPQSDGIFAHMSPIFAIASWPVAAMYRKKIILWYLHRSVTWRLKLAVALSDNVVTAAKDSLMLKSEKIIEVGHGIDANKFKTERNWSDGQPLKILSVGRISKIKNYETLIEAAKILKDDGINITLKIIGRPIMSGDFSYFEYLNNLVSKLELEKEVDFVGFIPYNKISQYYKESDFCVGPLPTGGVDKAMLEAMASGCITLTSNEVFKKYFGRYSDILIFEYQNSKDLALKLQKLHHFSAEEKNIISQFLTDAVKEYHDIGKLIDILADLYGR